MTRRPAAHEAVPTRAAHDFKRGWMSYISREEARLADAIRAEAIDPKTNTHTMQPRDAYAEARRRLGIDRDGTRLPSQVQEKK